MVQDSEGFACPTQTGLGDESIKPPELSWPYCLCQSIYQALSLGSTFSFVPNDNCPFVGGTSSFYILFSLLILLWLL